VAAQRDSGWILVLTAVVVIATQAAAVAISAATSVQTRWPLGLEAVRAHPFQWSIAFTVLIVAAGSAAWWLQVHQLRHLSRRQLPVFLDLEPDRGRIHRAALGHDRV
jgi:threonine/homoserine efflux transporter RhtA